MLDRAHRFHGYNALSFTYKNGRTVRGPLLSLKYAPNSRRQTYRAAVVVSKKVSKSAVTRNRLRRRLYEAIRLQAPHINGSYDLIFSVFGAELLTLPAGELQALVAQQLQQAGITSVKTAPHGIVGTEGKS